MTHDPSPSLQSSAEIDTTVSHSARVWNYWLGGKDNFAADREVGDQIAGDAPRHRRHRARPTAQFLAGRCGTWPARPGSGSSSTSAPACPPPTTPTRSRSASPRLAGSSTSTTTRWCWSHARALLTSTPEGATDYIDADLRDPDEILGRGRRDPRLRPARRHHAAGHPALHRSTTTRRTRRRPLWTPCRPAATWRSRTPRRHRRTLAEPSATGTSSARPRSSAAPPADRRASSTAWNSSNRAWSPARAGAPTTTLRRAHEVDLFCAVGRKP